MSANRFQFLEFEEEEDPPRLQLGHDSDNPPNHREVHPEILNDGSALAEVRITDPRGYGNFDNEGEAQQISFLAGRTEPVPTRLSAVEVFGERGAKAGQFQYPTGLALDRGGVLFVADSSQHRIQRITPSGGVSVIGSRGTGRGQFLSPQGIATDDDDAFYILEQDGGRVQKFTKEGVLVMTFGRPGRGAGEFHQPSAITVAPGSRNIYIADTGNHRVQRFDPTGRFVSYIGGVMGYESGLDSPQALVAEPGGSLTIADTFAGRLLRFDPLGRLDRQYGSNPREQIIRRSAIDPVSFYQPRALAADPSGLLYVADGGKPDPLTGETQGRVQCLSYPEGKLVISVDKLGRSLGNFLRPGGLAVAASGTGRGDLYVADTMNHRILRFAWS